MKWKVVVINYFLHEIVLTCLPFSLNSSFDALCLSVGPSATEVAAGEKENKT